MSLFLLSVQIGIQGILVWSVVLLDPFRNGFFKLAFQNVAYICKLAKNDCYCDVSRKWPCHATANNVAMVHGKPDWQEHPFDMLVARGFSWSKGSQLIVCPLALGVPYFPFSVHNLQNCCQAPLEMFKQIFSAVSNFFWRAYSFYSCPEKVWLVTHLASRVFFLGASDLAFVSMCCSCYPLVTELILKLKCH